jgi:hypothetical protein
VRVAEWTNRIFLGLYDRTEILPCEKGIFTAQTSRSFSLQKALKLTSRNSRFSCTNIHDPPNLKIFPTISSTTIIMLYICATQVIMVQVMLRHSTCGSSGCRELISSVGAYTT